jgi:hypothetical protein
MSINEDGAYLVVVLVSSSDFQFYTGIIYGIFSAAE